MRLAYVAAPVGATTQAEVDENLERAQRWYRWLCDTHPDRAFCMNWVVDVQVYRGADSNVGIPGEPEHEARIRGLERDDAVIAKCDDYFLVTDRISGGMRRGLETAKQHGLVIYDFTTLAKGFGGEPPKGMPIKLSDCRRGYEWLTE